ncbi:hypothetical protein XA3_00310 [Xylocopilactobacillus apicola]|uniref:Uncharacterized protein n=1 Tax=Xylocopilactobacillus apicola TaxID=2932184 RepID=A0AAU9D5P1_9LACO|nr:hypothetical protein XA3_00310 [Xylocopilactobacillus apicola]
MKIDSLLDEELKNPEFAEFFQIESKKLNVELDLYDESIKNPKVCKETPWSI